ncbi:MAG: EamA family transporter, partial [Nitrospiraceae bacterium]|nr:EamA family transporter [Nitrospiraceae bacterium]
LSCVFCVLASFFMKNYLKIIVAMLIWSTWGPMIRWLALPPDVVLFSTSLVASFTVPAFLAIRGELHLGGVGRYWWLFGLLALSSITNNISYFYALGHTTVSNAVFTHYTAPIFVALLAPIVISERLQKITMLSLPIAVLGMVMIVMAGGGLVLQGEHTAGIVAGTISGLAYAFIIIFSRKLSRMLMHHKAVVLLPWITTVVMAPAVFLSDYHLDGRQMSLLLLTGVFHSTLAPLLYYDALRKVMAQHAAILGYMEPLAAIPLAYVLLSETPSLFALFGGALILFSGYLVVRSRPGQES